jgi:hypothetical protein
MFQMGDKEFDNDDSPYVKLSMRNMQKGVGGDVDRVPVPLVACENEMMPKF